MIRKNHGGTAARAQSVTRARLSCQGTPNPSSVARGPTPNPPKRDSRGATVRFGVPLFLAALALAVAPRAHALWDDQLELFAGYAVFHDDNVLREPEATGPESDQYRVTTLGLNLDVAQGQQRYLGGLRVDAVRYDTFEQLDLDGHDGFAEWQWRASRTVSGRLGASHRRALASLAGVQAGVPSNVRNVITSRRFYADNGIFLTNRWELGINLARLDETNDAALRIPNDLVRDSLATTLTYVSRAGNRAGGRLAIAQGKMPNLQPIGGALIDNSHRDVEYGALLSWVFTAKTSLEAAVGQLDRNYDQLPQRDFDVETYRLALDWDPTGRLSLALVAEKGLGRTEDIHVTAVLAESVGLYPTWRPTAKTEVRGFIETADRTYLGDAARVLGVVGPRAEQVDAFGISLTYRPVEPAELGVSLRNEERSPVIGITPYDVQILGLQVRLEI